MSTQPSSSAAISGCPYCRAMAAGVLPSCDWRARSAPAFHSRAAISRFPVPAAVCSGVMPLDSPALGSPPCSSSRPATAACPAAHAECSGVTCRALREAWFGLAPASSSRRAALRWPKKAARPSAVKSSAEYCSTSWRSTARSSTIRASAPSAQASKKSGGRLPSTSGASSGWRVYTAQSTVLAPSGVRESAREGSAASNARICAASPWRMASKIMLQYRAAGRAAHIESCEIATIENLQLQLEDRNWAQVRSLDDPLGAVVAELAVGDKVKRIARDSSGGRDVEQRSRSLEHFGSVDAIN